MHTFLGITSIHNPGQITTAGKQMKDPLILIYMGLITGVMVHAVAILQINGMGKNTKQFVLVIKDGWPKT